MSPRCTARRTLSVSPRCVRQRSERTFFMSGKTFSTVKNCQLWVRILVFSDVRGVRMYSTSRELGQRFFAWNKRSCSCSRRYTPLLRFVVFLWGGVRFTHFSRGRSSEECAFFCLNLLFSPSSYRVLFDCFSHYLFGHFKHDEVSLVFFSGFTGENALPLQSVALLFGVDG